MDVVPVEADKWDVDPFGGTVKDGYIYGRGTIDVKNTLMVRFLYTLQLGLIRLKTPFSQSWSHWSTC